MSCSQCQSVPSRSNCPHELSFKVDGAYLAPYIGGAPIEPIDLTTLVQSAETDTQLQLDVPGKRLLYSGERASNGVGTPDSLLLSTIAALIQLKELADVDYDATNNGDMLIFNNLTQSWEGYTVPEGTVVSQLGLDADGKPVKQLSAGTLPDASVEVPLGGSILWTAPEQFLPSNFVVADGRQLNRSVYAAYFALVGTTYGPGNGTTTFNIPNIAGRVPVGVDVNQTEFNALGKTGGEKKHALTATENGAHSHSVFDPSHNHGVFDPGHSHSLQGAPVYVVGSSTLHLVDGNREAVSYGNTQTGGSGTGIGIYGNYTGIGINNSGDGTPHNILQPFISEFWVVRVA